MTETADEKAEAMVTALAQDAIAAAGGETSFASVLLVDAALSILVTSQTPAAARQIASTLAGYVVAQVNTVVGSGEARQ